MTDPDDDHKTVPDLRSVPPVAERPRPASDASTSDPPPNEKEAFNPFKFQSVTMPPGLRAEIIEHARNRPAEHVPADTLPPDHEAAPNGATLDEAVTIRIASDNEDTVRLPRVILARRRKRRKRAAVFVVPILGAVTLGVVVWTHQGSKTEPAPAVAGPDAVPRSAEVATAALPADPNIPPVPTLTAPVAAAVAPEREKEAPTASAVPPHRARVAAAPERAPSKPRPATSPAPKATSTTVKSVDLLDFQGPAPK